MQLAALRSLLLHGCTQRCPSCGAPGQAGDSCTPMSSGCAVGRLPAPALWSMVVVRSTPTALILSMNPEYPSLLLGLEICWLNLT